MKYLIILDGQLYEYEDRMTWRDWLVCAGIAVPALVMLWVVVVLVFSL